MPGPILTTDAIVLLKRPPAESFETLSLFSADEGALRVLHRVARKPSPAHVTLDLFDEATFWLEGAASGTWFVKEVRLLTRHAGIGRRYDRLQAASAFTTLVAQNPVADESRPAVHRLLRTALTAFATAERADIVYFKSLYCFARDEGHPLKQQWFPTLPAEDRAEVTGLLNRPLAQQHLAPAAVARLRGRLEEFLRGHTEIVVG